MNKKHLRQRAVVAALTCTTFFSVIGKEEIAFAQETEEYQMEDIIVTASRVEENAFSSNANISVITKETIEKNHYNNLTDALRDISGVTIQNYGNGGGNYTSNSIYVNGTKNVVFLVDGMRVNTNGSTFSKFSGSELANMDNIERIEVLKGSASTLYGSDASGGVINIITKKGVSGNNKTTLSIGSGSFGTEQYNISNTGRNKDGIYWSFSSQKDLNGNFKDGHGNTILQKINAESNDFKIGKDFDKDTSLALNYQSYKSDYIRPKNGGIHETQTSAGEKDNHRIALTYNNRISERAINQISLYRNENYLNDNYKDPMNVWLMDLETLGFSDQVTYKTNDHTLVSGLDFYQDKILKYSSTSYGHTSEWHDKTITNRALYLQDTWQFREKWKLTSGIRTDNHSVYGRHNTPSFVLGYEPNEKTNYYVGYKEYFVSPNQFELYSSYGSLDLQPETGKTVEFGINHKFDNTLKGSFNVFERNAENMIGFNNTTYKYYNIGEEHARGWDMNLTKQFNDKFSANVGYTYLYIRPADQNSNPNRNGYLPKGVWNLGLQYEQDKFDMQLNGRGIIDREGRKSKNTADEFKTFWVWDTALNYKIQDNATAFIKINNIFNKFYTDQCYDMNPDGNWYSAPGRNFQVGIKYTF